MERPGGRLEASSRIGVALGMVPEPLSQELIEAALAGAAELGRDACIIRPGDDQSHLAVLLGIGHPGIFRPVFAAPRASPRAIWVGEPMVSHDELPRSAVAGVARSRLFDYLKDPLRPLLRAPVPGPLARLRAAALLERRRAANVRELVAFARDVDRVVVTSRDRQAVLLQRGVTAVAVPFGYSAATAGPLVPPGLGTRDVAFLYLGNPGAQDAGRRSVVSLWQAQEPHLTVADGVWGRERASLLQRTRVVLNPSRVPGNFAGVRLVLAIAAGAVVVSEPMTDPFPFAAGVHFVEAPLDELLDAARELVADEPRRRRIAENGQTLLQGELSMGGCLARALGLGP